MRTAPALATAITSRDEFIAFYTAPQNISEFALSVLPQSILAEASEGDYLAQEILAADVKNIVRLEAMTDTELQTEHSFNRLAHLQWLEHEDPSEYDINDREDYYQQQWLIEDLLHYRKTQREYTGHGPLTHRPFAALAS